jgi:hypothetical protein
MVLQTPDDVGARATEGVHHLDAGRVGGVRGSRMEDESFQTAMTRPVDLRTMQAASGNWFPHQTVTHQNKSTVPISEALPRENTWPRTRQ